MKFDWFQESDTSANAIIGRVQRERDAVGPIRPEHATGGWTLKGDHSGRWYLSKPAGHGTLARIMATGTDTCAWGIYHPDGRMIREASAESVQDAKALAQRWIQENR